MMTKLRQRRAQALVETAMILPVLIYLMLGAADFSRAFYLKLAMAGASRAGMRMAVLGSVNDIGNAVRSEPNSAIPNTAAAWGSEGPGQTNSDCTSATPKCGDPNGCAAASFTVATQIACFAVRSCISWAGGVCTPAAGGWNTRPGAGADQAVEVLVVYKFAPATPFIANFTPGGGGFFFLPGDTLGLQLY
jgi:Flp pilus assembly protein TadG